MHKFTAKSFAFRVPSNAFSLAFSWGMASALAATVGYKSSHTSS
jgi:hypothetical protein